MNNQLKIPFFQRASIITIGLLALITLLFVTQSVLLPLIYATIIGIVLSPVVNFLVAKRMNRIVAIALTLIAVIGSTISIISLLSSQISLFSNALPALLAKFDHLSHQTEAWVSQKFNIPAEKIKTWADDTRAELLTSVKALIGPTLVNIGSILVVLFLIPVYTFMILFYQPLLIEFIHRLFSQNKTDAVNDVLLSTKKIIRSYLVGLLMEAVIIATLNSSSLLILGIDYAILIGVIGALLNVIPYIGGIIAVALPMIMAIATKSPTYALLVLAAYLLIQFIDNHYIVPKIVASKVKINALVSIVVVLAGGLLWGLAGMFLSIPLTAILKVIFDHVGTLKPWGYLLGDVVHSPSQSPFFKKILK